MGARCGLGFHQSSAGAGEILGAASHSPMSALGQEQTFSQCSSRCPLRTNSVHSLRRGQARYGEFKNDHLAAVFPNFESANKVRSLKTHPLFGTEQACLT